jgi:hypothetical protein
MPCELPNCYPVSVEYINNNEINGLQNSKENFESQTTPSTIPLSTYQQLFNEAGCTKNLIEGDIGWWRARPNMRDVINDMSAYGTFAKNCSGDNRQHEFCQPGRCVAPANAPLSTYQKLFNEVGCTRDLKEGEIGWWRERPNMKDVINDMNAYGTFAKNCSGDNRQHEFCQPGRCVAPANAPLSTYQKLFNEAGCTRNLKEGEIGWWRERPNMRDVINDMNAYGNLTNTCTGNEGQKNFCNPHKCTPPTNLTIPQMQTFFNEAGCTKTLTENDETVKWWKTRGSVQDVLNDMKVYGDLTKTCSGTSVQHEFCSPGKCNSPGSSTSGSSTSGSSTSGSSTTPPPNQEDFLSNNMIIIIIGAVVLFMFMFIGIVIIA